MKQAAPIVLFVFNRPEHTRITLEALAGNPLAGSSRLYIFSDGPRGAEDAPAVEAVRGLCREISGFSAVTLIEAERNKGLAPSVIDGLNHIFSLHGEAIVLEDDVVPAPFFLTYMNQGLSLYRDKPEVGVINAFNFTNAPKIAETYFIRQPSCWGWATWADRWSLFSPNADALLKEIAERGLIDLFDVEGHHPFYEMLREARDGIVSSWAIRWYASLFLAEKISLWPGVGLTRNIGFDGSGTHCGDNKTLAAAVGVFPKEPPRVLETPIVISPLGQRIYNLTIGAGVCSPELLASVGRELGGGSFMAGGLKKIWARVQKIFLK